MPVKVRCPSCQKVLNAPDAARGKAVKCPQCEGRVPVPAGGSKAGAGGAKKKSAAVDDDDFLSGLDFSRAEDQSVKLCKKCGAELAEDATECPECGIDLSTGGLGKAAQKARRKGPDPDLFYKDVWKESWKFTLANGMLTVRTVIYTTIFYLITLGCLWLYFWCFNLPPKVFSGFLTVVVAMAVPGWMWFLAVEIIQATMQKKDVLKRINFDFFLCVSLGLKAVAWVGLFFLPTGLVGGLLMVAMNNAGMEAAGIGVFVLLNLVAAAMFPVVMAHMAMPVSGRAWLMPVILPIWARTIGPSLYWCMVFVVTNLVAIGGFTAVGIVYGEDLTTLVTSLNVDSTLRRAKALAEEQGPTHAPGEQDEALADLERRAAESPVDWNLGLMPAVLIYLCLVAFSATSVFNMRGLGWFAYYFRRKLDLITQEPEKKYVRKEQEIGPDGQPIKQKSSRNLTGAFAGLGGAIAFYVIANVILYFATGGEYLLLPRPLAQLLNLANGPVANAPAANAPAE